MKALIFYPRSRRSTVQHKSASSAVPNPSISKSSGILFLFSLAFVLLFFSPRGGSAQSIIQGYVNDSLGAPISFANVLLLYPNDSSLAKGMVTNEQGGFVFDGLNAGIYLLKASMVGYEDVYRPSLEIVPSHGPLLLNNIVMKAVPEELEEVTVHADKALFEMKIDRMVVNVQSSIMASSGTALQILERSPGVKVDHFNHTVSMNSKNGVQVMINGKLDRMPMESLYQMLSSMQAASIEKIELITMPPANLDAGGNAGFINIILAENEEDGVNGSLFINGEMRRKFNGAIGGDINIRKNRFNLFALYSFIYQRSLEYVEIERVMNLPEYLFEYNSKVDRNSGNDIHNIRLGMDYSLSPKTTLGILTTFHDRNHSQFTGIHADFRLNPGPDSLMNGYRNNKHLVGNSMANLNLRHLFSESKQLNLDLDYFQYKDRQPQDFTFRYHKEGIFIQEDHIRINKKSPIAIWVAKLDYMVETGEQTLWESGIKFTQTGFYNDILFENKAEESWIKNPAFSESSEMDEAIAAVYTTWTFKTNESDHLKLGLRFEYTDAKLISEQAEIASNRYGSLFPTIFYSKKLNENSTWQIAANRRITRPSFLELAPFVVYNDPVSFFTGNSFLRPAITESGKMDFRHKGMIFSLQADRIKDAIYQFQPQADPVNNVTIYSSLNIDRAQVYVFNITLPLNPSPWWEVQNNLQAMLQKIKTNLKEAPFRSSQKSFSINSSHTFKLPRDFSMEVSGFFNSPSLSGIRKVKAFGAANFGVRKEFRNNGGKLNLSFTDIFRTNQRIWESNLTEQHLSEMFIGDFDIKGIKLSYTNNFGSQKVKGARKRETGSAEEQKRL